MGKCLKGKSEVKKSEATYQCKKCGARTDDKKHVCKPAKADSNGEKDGKKKKKKD